MQEFKGTYDGLVAIRVVYYPTKFEKNSLKIKEIIANILTCVRVLGNRLYFAAELSRFLLVSNCLNSAKKSKAISDTLASSL